MEKGLSDRRFKIVSWIFFLVGWIDLGILPFTHWRFITACLWIIHSSFCISIEFSKELIEILGTQPGKNGISLSDSKKLTLAPPSTVE